MIRGAPGGGAVGSLPPADGLAVPLPSEDGDPGPPVLLLDPRVPVVSGFPTVPAPVPKLGVVLVFAGPGPPGIPAPDVGPG
jgi:hypothetical protein